MKIFLKILLGFLCFIMSALIFLLIFLPTLLSTDLGKSLIINQISKNTSGHVSIEKLQLSWLGNQKVENLKLLASDNTPILSFDSLSGNFSLFTFLFDNSVKTLSLKNFSAVIDVDQNGRTNFDRLLAKDSLIPKDQWSEPVYIKNVNVELKNTGLEFFLEANGQTAQNDLEGLFDIEAVYGEEKKLRLHATNVPSLFLDQLLGIKHSELKGLIVNLLGEKINEINITTIANTLSLDALSPALAAKISGHLKKDSFIIDNSSTISFDLPKENVANIQDIYSISLAGKPLNNLIGTIQFNHVMLPLVRQNINELEGEIEIALKPISFESNLIVNQGNIAIEFPPAEKLFLLKTHFIGKEQDSNYNVDLTFSIDKSFLINSKFVDRTLKAEGMVNFRQYNAEIIGYKENDKIKFTLIPQNPNLPKIDLDVIQKRKEDINLEGSLVITGIRVQAFGIYELKIPFKTDSNRADFSLRAYSEDRKNVLDGSGYATNFLQDGSFSLNKIESEVRINVYETDLLNSGHLFKGNIEAHLNSEGNYAANFQLLGSKQSQIKRLVGSLLGSKKNNEIAFQCNADDSFLQGSLSHQNWKFYPLTLGIQGQLKNFPLSFLCPMIDSVLCNKLTAIFGTIVNGNASAEILNGEGPLSFVVSGENSSLQLQGSVKNNFLSLNEPLTAEVKITKDFEKAFLQEMTPFLVPIVEAKDVIRISISPDKFTIPLNSFLIDKMHINKGEIHFPELKISNKSKLGNITALIGIKDNFEVNFTPLYFSVKESILHLPRMDMLINHNFPIASWGDIDFKKDRLKVYIGVSAVALEKAFNVSSLPQNGMLVIPISGSPSQPTVDSKKALAKILSLTAQEKLGDSSGLSFLLEATNILLNSEVIPPPTTNPLPWENLYREDKDEQKDNKDLINDVKNEAKNLIKDLLKAKDRFQEKKS